MKAPKTIAVDVDGTIADLEKNWLAWYNRDYNDNVEFFTEWDTHKLVKSECGFKMYDYLKDPHLYDDVLPIDGAILAIEKLKSLGYRIIYPTTSPIESFGRKYQWLLNYGLITTIKDYIEVNDKSLIRADILVDDRPKNLDDFTGKKILFAQRWNELEKDNPTYLYASSWNDVLDYCYE
jgi:5'(3')-deoxyribonucleotidase